MFQIYFLDSELESSVISFDTEGIKGREDGKRGEVGRLFEGGDYSREAINRVTAIIQGNTVSYSNVNNWHSTVHS